jgi:hypothetical protein
MSKKYPDNAEILVLMGQTKLAQNGNDDAKKLQGSHRKQPRTPTAIMLCHIYMYEQGL